MTALIFIQKRHSKWTVHKKRLFFIAIWADISSLLRSHVPLSEQRVDTPRTFNTAALLHTNPSKDSQAWKKYSYLDEGSARGIVWHNRKRIQCSVSPLRGAAIQSPSYRRQSNLAVMCKDTYLPGEDFNTIFLGEMEINDDSGLSVLYIQNIWSQ